MFTVPRSVLESPAVELLCRLEDQGFDLAVHKGRLRVTPGDRLNVAQEAEIRQYRDDLVLLVRVCDPGVQTRLAAFKAQSPSTAPVLLSGVRYVAGVCYSCAERLEPGRHGRCWRCGLALRLAWTLPVSNTDLTLTQGGDDAESLSRSLHELSNPRPVPRDPTPDLVTRSTTVTAATPEARKDIHIMKATTLLSEYIKSDTVKQSGPMVLKITDWEVVEFKDEKSGRTDKKLALAVDNGQKLVLNVENSRTLIEGFGDETDDWIGRTLEAYFEPNVTFGGKKVGGLRVRVPKSDDAVEAVS